MNSFPANKLSLQDVYWTVRRAPSDRADEPGNVFDGLGNGSDRDLQMIVALFRVRFSKIGVRAHVIAVRLKEIGVRFTGIAVRFNEIGVRATRIAVRLNETAVRFNEIGVRFSRGVTHGLADLAAFDGGDRRFSRTCSDSLYRT